MRVGWPSAMQPGGVWSCAGLVSVLELMQQLMTDRLFLASRCTSQMTVLGKCDCMTGGIRLAQYVAGIQQCCLYKHDAQGSFAACRKWSDD